MTRPPRAPLSLGGGAIGTFVPKVNIFVDLVVTGDIHCGVAVA